MTRQNMILLFELPFLYSVKDVSFQFLLFDPTVPFKWKILVFSIFLNEMNYSGTPAIFTPCLHEVSKIIENLILFKFFTGEISDNLRLFTVILR